MLLPVRNISPFKDLMGDQNISSFTLFNETFVASFLLYPSPYSFISLLHYLSPYLLRI